MKELCARHNCEEVRVDGDGNCQFRALSLGLYGSEDHHADVRANIVQHLRENPETYSAFMEPDEDFTEYINRISQDGQWGDEVTLRAFGPVQLPVPVLRPAGRRRLRPARGAPD